MKRLIIALLMATVALSMFGSVAFARTTRATDLFVGKATTGAGQPTPVDVNPSDIKVAPDGSIGLGYTYKATGTARGDVDGPMNYEEHGHLYFTNPADQTTFTGSSFESGVFTIAATREHKAVSIADTNPAAYQHGVKTIHLGNGSHTRAFQLRNHQPVDFSYGYFTFTDPLGTFTGYATTDFRSFFITIAFPYNK